MSSELLPQIEGVPPNSARIRDAIELARAERRYLGFLPDEGFYERAEKGTLLIAVAGGQTIGYVLYDLPGNWITLRHLCVARDTQGSGVARALVEEIRRRHPERAGIELACRSDFPADAIWPKLGFTPSAYRRGRSRRGHELTIWLDDFGHPNLFTAAEGAAEARDLAVVDHNVFNDLVSDRPQGKETRELDQDWIGELIELCITDEVNLEIHKCPEAEMKRHLQQEAALFRKVRETGWRSVVSRVAELAPEAEDSDHNHLARAIAGGATYFVTRDDEVLDAAADLEREFDILAIRPSELIIRLDRLRAQGRYEPALLHGTAISSVGPDRVDEAALVRAFLNHGAGERVGAFRERLRGLLAQPERHSTRIFQTADGLPLGLLAMRESGGTLEVSLIRVVTGDRLASAVARQLAFLPRQAAADANRSEVSVSDPNPSAAVIRAFPEEGYEHVTDTWRCCVARGLEEWTGPTGLPREVVAAERRCWPRKVTGGGLETFMVSIHPWWASQLFDTHLASETLEGRSLELGLSREHVYYRSPQAPGGIRAPARILWYVKGGTPAHRIGAVRAVSILDEVVVDRVKTLFRRFERLGIWTEQQVRTVADAKKEVMALRFTDTELFECPLDLEALRRLYAEHGERFSAPQGPRRVPEHTFRLIYSQASAYASH